MFRTSLFSLLTATSLLSGASLAEAATASGSAVAVQVAGRDTRAVRADIVAAARKVCATGQLDTSISDVASDDCVSETVADAMRQLAPVETAYVVAGR